MDFNTLKTTLKSGDIYFQSFDRSTYYLIDRMIESGDNYFNFEGIQIAWWGDPRELYLTLGTFKKEENGYSPYEIVEDDDKSFYERIMRTLFNHESPEYLLKFNSKNIIKA